MFHAKIYKAYCYFLLINESACTLYSIKALIKNNYWLITLVGRVFAIGQGDQG